MNQLEQLREQCAKVVNKFVGAEQIVEAIRALPLPEVVKQFELEVWYGSMPESNGRHNYTAMLKRKGSSWLDGDEYTFQRSEYPDRVRYEADFMRYLIGEISERPFILNYDADKHSGYVDPHYKDLRKENEQLRRLLSEFDEIMTASCDWPDTLEEQTGLQKLVLKVRKIIGVK